MYYHSVQINESNTYCIHDRCVCAGCVCLFPGRVKLSFCFFQEIGHRWHGSSVGILWFLLWTFIATDLWLRWLRTLLRKLRGTPLTCWGVLPYLLPYYCCTLHSSTPCGKLITYRTTPPSLWPPPPGNCPPTCRSWCPFSNSSHRRPYSHQQVVSWSRMYFFCMLFT